MTPEKISGASFNKLGLAKSLLQILSQQNFTTPTPIQKECIPVALKGQDVVGIAQTGTGKTLAFGLPMIQLLATQGGQGLILLPTRELALQCDEMLQRVGRPCGLRTAVLIGGANMRQQITQLRQKPHIVISTPGRLIDHIQQRNYSLAQVTIIVLDEADRMLDIGFMPQIRQILSGATGEQQTLMFSATMPPPIAEITARYMKLPLHIEVAPSGTASENVEQELYVAAKEAKLPLLEKILAEQAGTALVFSRTKHGARKISEKIIKMGHRATELHSNRSLAQRRAALDGFKSGKYRVLVATDIAARGIDVKNIALVINYDLPDNPEDYVHRIGRTGRAGATGRAISFVTPLEKYNVKQIERLIKKTIPVIDLPEDLSQYAAYTPKEAPVERGLSRLNNNNSHRRHFGRRR